VHFPLIIRKSATAVGQTALPSHQTLQRNNRRRISLISRERKSASTRVHQPRSSQMHQIEVGGEGAGSRPFSNAKVFSIAKHAILAKVCRLPSSSIGKKVRPSVRKYSAPGPAPGPPETHPPEPAIGGAIRESAPLGLNARLPHEATKPLRRSRAGH